MTKRLELLTDKFGRHTCGNYTIEPWKHNNTWSIYNRFNSMYDTKDGFKSPQEAVEYINRMGA